MKALKIITLIGLVFLLYLAGHDAWLAKKTERIFNWCYE